MKKRMQQGLSLLLAILMFASLVVYPPSVRAAESDAVMTANPVTTADPATTEYELYPIPQSITYTDSVMALSATMNVFYGASIDEYTKARAVEAFQEAGITLTETGPDQAAVLVGVASDRDAALTGLGVSESDAVFQKIDGYRMKAAGDKLYVVGRHTDAAFYGLATLLQILQQVDDSTRQLRCFDLSDWADVASRGFIEGYYGEAWSVEDRVELMRWGGYYKLNSYFYAAQDDPKLVAQWRELYTDEELENRIAPLATAGHASKCQFVFALNPFMYNPIKSSNYDESLEALKQKFEQTMQYGVRQIAVMANETVVPGGNNETGWALQTKLMQDLVDWVSSPAMQAKYPGLKTTVPFCPSAYQYGSGNAQLQYFGQNMPASVPLVVTGGKTWGEVSQSFTQSFTSWVGRGPCMWINWPCTDSSRSHLIMGGYTEFLQVGVQPEQIQGIILNPMQQSEPSKVAIFGNACYSWNIWTQEEADQAWIDSFKYVDHQSYEETPASTALRELSKHMINQNMDGRVVSLEESVEIRDLLTRVCDNLNDDVSVAQGDIDQLKEIFTVLQEAAATYKTYGNERIRNQIIYWLNSWEELTEANLLLLDALDAIENNGDSSLIISNYREADALYAASSQHGFQYVDDTQYAEVGVQHIQPFTKALLSAVGQKAEMILDPTKVLETPIHSFGDTGTSGSSVVDNMLDNDTESYTSFARIIHAGDYVGVTFSRKVDIDRVAILTGTTGTSTECLPACRLEYTTDKVTWLEVPNGAYAGGNTLYMTDLGLQDVMGIRAYTTASKQSRLTVREIQINDEVSDEVQGTTRLTGTVFHSENVCVAAGALENILDGATDSYVYLRDASAGIDTVPADAYIGIDFGAVKKLGRIQITQADGDKITDGVLEYSTDGSRYTEVPGGAVNGNTQINLNTLNIEAQYLRIRNKTQTSGWVQIFEFVVEAYDPSVVSMTLIRTPDWTLVDGFREDALFDGNDRSSAYYDPRNGENDDVSLVGDYIGVDLGKVITVGDVRFVLGQNGSADKWTEYKLEYSTDNLDWKTFKTYTGDQLGEEIVEEDLKGAEARYIRLTNAKETKSWLYFSEISVAIGDPNAITVDFLYKSPDATVAMSQGEMDEKHASVNASSVTLPANAYLGIDLGKIRPVSTITVQQDSGDAITVLGGASRSQLAPLSLPLEGVQNIRYIELVNTSSQEVTFCLTALTAAYEEATGPYFLETTMGIDSNYGADDSRRTGTTGNLFDGDLNTWVKFADYPAQDGYILYDLGQTRDITNLKLYVQDTDIGFIRDGKVQVSMSRDSGWVDVITIGDGVENTDDFNDTALSSGLYQVSSTYPNKLYVEGEVPATQARYLRILFTAPHQRRFVVAYEIVINDGEYVPEQNAAFTAVPTEQRGYAPSQVADGNLNTGFRPNMQGVTEGYLIYRLSEVTDLEQINVSQDGTAISAARPVTLYVKGSNTNGAFVQVGQLTEAVSNVPVYDSSIIGDVYELKFAWSGITPTIYEICVLPRGILEVDTSALSALLNRLPTVEQVNGLSSDYPQTLKDAYAAAYLHAQTLAVTPPQYQAEVVEAQNQLNDSYDALAAVLDAERTRLANQIAAYRALNANQYTAESWSAFQNVLATVETALGITDLADIGVIQQAYDQLIQAHDALVRKPSAKQILSFEVADALIDINEQTHQITATAPYGTQVDSLTPIITVSDQAQVFPESGVTQDFTAPVVYTVTAADGSQQEYTVTVDVLPHGAYIIRKDTALVNGTITIVPQTASEGETIQVTAVPNEGYELPENGIQVYRTDDRSVTVPVAQDGSFQMPPFEVTVTASFEAICYTVTFNSNGGSGVPSQVVSKGAAAVAPLPPTKQGWRFGGWYTDASLTTAYDFSTPVTGNLTLYAKWIENGSTSGGSSGSSSTTEITNNPDGSVTTTVTNPDGSQKITTRMKDGSHSVTVTERNGMVATTVYLSKERIEAAERAGTAVAAPMPDVSVSTNWANAQTITVYLESEHDVVVEIPVKRVTAGMVAVLVQPGGTENVMPNSWTTETGVTAKLSDGNTIKIVDHSKTFIDVPSSHWGYSAVAFASSRELFAGTGENRFSPDIPMSRAMIVTVLARYEGVDTTAGVNWYDAGRQWAIAQGISDGSNMDGNLTREQLATMLYRYAGAPAVTGTLNGFADASSVSDYAKQAMAWAVENGLITGVTNSTLAPQGEATRVQVAAILQRYIQSMV